MSKRMTVHDTRIRGILTPNAASGRVYCVNQGFRVANIFAEVANYASQIGGLEKLFILAHGAEDITLPRPNGSEYQSFGGCGEIRIGAESLGQRNIEVVDVLKGKVRTIVLIVCCIADNADPRLYGTRYDGMGFCYQLAERTGAEVIASSNYQIYGFENTSLFDWLSGNMNKINWLTLVDMEPPVYRYYPNGRLAITSR